ncbi:hypothetical protein GCM10017673_11980 [Streptosporangium violaceochromogenes]|nr:hypothetical protein GCM10017673_11980 [Streptosporangium violaceochromogenes]
MGVILAPGYGAGRTAWENPRSRDRRTAQAFAPAQVRAAGRGGAGRFGAGLDEPPAGAYVG